MYQKMLIAAAVVAVIAASGCGAKSTTDVPAGMKTATMTQTQIQAMDDHMDKLHGLKPNH